MKNILLKRSFFLVVILFISGCGSERDAQQQTTFYKKENSIKSFNEFILVIIFYSRKT